MQVEEPISPWALLPDGILCKVLSCLHGLSLAGPVACVSRDFKAACNHESLCQHVVERDFGLEDQEPLPEQPARPWRGSDVSQQILLQQGRRDLPMDLLQEAQEPGRGAAELRWWALHCSSTPMQALAEAAAKDGRPTLLSWLGRHITLQTLSLDGEWRSALAIASVFNRPLTVASAAMYCELDGHVRPHGTSLHLAAYVGAAAAAGMLIHLQADLEARNHTFRQTPLHVACSRNHTEVVRLLLEARSDASLLDGSRWSATDIARSMGGDEALLVLMQHTQGA
mmetsp:Transcript_29518/g.68072  ORF Transcript_29518/g.68072 Transcript_29518/m.68072 type:complete len:283 (+) Transcript_29518:129-977(+)